MVSSYKIWLAAIAIGLAIGSGIFIVNGASSYSLLWLSSVASTGTSSSSKYAIISSLGLPTTGTASSSAYRVAPYAGASVPDKFYLYLPLITNNAN